jgi:predicted ATPase
MRESRNKLTAYDASEGALYILFLLVLALHPRSPKFLAIDNFDQALNPRLARAAMRQFADLVTRAGGEKQVLLTTHNPLVLDGLDIRNDDIRLFVVDRSSKGFTQIRRIHATERVVQDVDKGVTLSTLWVTGRLGGVPDI